ncbi:hypothetical protein RF11_15694 [Thelohanellus kitauei]|uniref:Uncharacterized protein n=1 Tax=Thelohanellus kitauei TaxID=669202 RepID=A0A0C2JKI8_THEKT|nr:hypothetical protein RF11_15694 [Thelohanellus kitauei]
MRLQIELTSPNRLFSFEELIKISTEVKTNSYNEYKRLRETNLRLDVDSNQAVSLVTDITPQVIGRRGRPATQMKGMLQKPNVKADLSTFSFYCTLRFLFKKNHEGGKHEFSGGVLLFYQSERS